LIYIEEGRRALNYLKNAEGIARRVKELVELFDPSAEVYLFGSAVRGDYTAASDIDILIVTKNVGAAEEARAAIYRAIDAPLEIHIATPEQFRRWYRRFLGEAVKIN
jgi:predicted nucleotidyltransferase